MIPPAVNHFLFQFPLLQIPEECIESRFGHQLRSIDADRMQVSECALNSYQCPLLHDSICFSEWSACKAGLVLLIDLRVCKFEKTRFWKVSGLRYDQEFIYFLRDSKQFDFIFEWY